jgi:hypothetical protein
MSGAGGGGGGGLTMRYFNHTTQQLVDKVAPNETTALRAKLLMYKDQLSRGEISPKEHILLVKTAIAGHKFNKGNITKKEHNNTRKKHLSNYYKLTPEEEKSQWAAYNAQTKAETNADPYVQAHKAEWEANKKLRNDKSEARKEQRKANIERSSTITTNPMFNQQRKEAEAMRQMVTGSEAGGRRSHSRRSDSRQKHKSRKNRKQKRTYTRRH